MEAILQRVTREVIGAGLAAAVAEGDQALVLDDSMDFPEEGGRLTLAGQSYTFTAVDEDTDVVTLADAVTAAAAAGEPVELLTALGEQASIWTAWVSLDDSPEPVPAHIPSRLVSFYVEGQDQAGSTITLRARDGRYEVETRPGSYVGETNLQVVVGGLAKLTGGGGLLLDNGVSAPTAKPRAATAWDDPSTYVQSTAHERFNPRSLWWDGAQWRFTESLFGGKVWTISPTDGATIVASPTFADNFHPYGGAVKIGPSWYVLGLIAGDWYVYIFDSSWVKTGGWYLASATNIGDPSLATNGTDLFMAYRIKSSNTLRLLQRTVAGVTVNSYDSPAGTWGANVVGLYIGAADFGATRAAVAWSDAVYVYSFSGSTLTRQTAQGWLPANGEEIRGVGWDGSHFHTLSENGKVWKYADVPVSATRSIKSTLYDNDAGGGGTHETTASPALTYIQKARQWMRVTVNSPQDAGGEDDPNAVRIYIDDQLQPDLATGQATVVYGAPATGGAAPPIENGFVGVSAPGYLISGASDADGPLIALYGDGSGRVGPLKWNSAGVEI